MFLRIAFFSLILVAFSAILCGDGAYSDPTEPPSGSGAIARVESISLFQIPERLNELKLQVAEHQQALSELPPLQNAMLFNAYGYHSDYLPATDELSAEPKWTIDLATGWAGGTLDFVLVPAVDRRGLEPVGYGFPKRFRIIVESRKGRIVTVVDWTKADFPNPGRRPVYFQLLGAVGNAVRLEVFEGQVENGFDYFALSRLYCIRHGEAQLVTDIEASSSYEVLPYWSIQYLKDGRSSLGLPVVKKERVEGDFVLDLTPEQKGKTLSVEIDFGENRRHGWVNLYPGQSSGDIRVPGFGLPGKIGLRLIGDEGNGQRGKVKFIQLEDLLGHLGDNLLRLPLKGFEARWVRLEFSEFPVYQGQAVFSLGEVEVERRGQREEIGGGAQVWIDGERMDVDTSALTDGMAAGSPILLMKDWFQGLAEAKPLEVHLRALEREQQVLQQRWQRLWRYGIAALVVLLGFGVISTVVYQVNKRRRDLKELRWQIAHDLHDEVGSNLGSISLTAERLQEDSQETQTREDLNDLSLLAREASASLRDVVWVVDQTTIRLTELVDKLVERAERVLSGVELLVEFESKLPDSVVPLRTKRHMVMFFKEVINNCARHSGATQVILRAGIVDWALVLSFADNGCGFDSATVVDGWGLGSLKKRAHELGGQMKLESNPGSGTMITLTLPLIALQKKTDYAYKTSN